MDWGISLDTEEEEYSNYLGEGVGISRNWGNSRFFPFYGWPYNFMAPVRHLAYADISQGFPGGSDGKESACNAGDPYSLPGSGRLLAKGMATHSSIITFRIPRTEEPGGLQSMRSQTVRHD